MRFQIVAYTASAVEITAGASEVATATNSMETIVGMIGIAIGAICAMATVYITWYFKKENLKLSKKAIKKGIKPKEL